MVWNTWLLSRDRLLASEGPDLSVLIPFPNSRIVLVRLILVAPDEFRRGVLLAAPKTRNHTTNDKNTHSGKYYGEKDTVTQSGTKRLFLHNDRHNSRPHTRRGFVPDKNKVTGLFYL